MHTEKQILMALIQKCKRNKIFYHEKLVKWLTPDVWHASLGDQQLESTPCICQNCLLQSIGTKWSVFKCYYWKICILQSRTSVPFSASYILYTLSYILYTLSYILYTSHSKYIKTVEGNLDFLMGSYYAEWIQYEFCVHM